MHCFICFEYHIKVKVHRYKGVIYMSVEHIKARKVKKLLFEAVFSGGMIEIFDEETGEIYDAEVINIKNDEVELILHIPVKWSIEKFMEIG